MSRQQIPNVSATSANDESKRDELRRQPESSLERADEALALFTKDSNKDDETKTDIEENQESPEDSQTFTHTYEAETLPVQQEDKQMVELKEPVVICDDQKEPSAQSGMTSSKVEHSESEAVSEHQMEQNTNELEHSVVGTNSRGTDITSQGKDNESRLEEQSAPLETSECKQFSQRQSSDSSETETSPKEYFRATPVFLRRDPEVEPAKPAHPLQHPPEDWRYTKLLVDLNKMITPDELDNMKDSFRRTFGKAVTERIIKPRDLFIKMEERQFLNENNIIYLQALLQELNRPELMKKTIDYCLSTAGVLHFQSASEAPENGYMYVKFHLHLDKEYTRRDLTELQSWVAKILCVPDHFVFIAGVEPSKSLLVTLMIPAMYVGILVEYLGKNLLQARFAELGIDTMTIDEKVYDIKVGRAEDIRTSDEQLVSLYHQLCSKDKQLQTMEDKCYRLEQTIIRQRKKDADITAKLAELEDTHSEFEQLERRIRNLEKQNNAQELFEQGCKQLKDCQESFPLAADNLKDVIDITHKHCWQLDENYSYFPGRKVFPRHVLPSKYWEILETLRTTEEYKMKLF